MRNLFHLCSQAGEFFLCKLLAPTFYVRFAIALFKHMTFGGFCRIVFTAKVFNDLLFPISQVEIHFLIKVFKMMERISRKIFMTQENPILVFFLVMKDQVMDDSPQQCRLFQDIVWLLRERSNFRFKWSKIISHQQGLVKKMREIMGPVQSSDAACKCYRVSDEYDNVHIECTREPFRRKKCNRIFHQWDCVTVTIERKVFVIFEHSSHMPERLNCWEFSSDAEVESQSIFQGFIIWTFVLLGNVGKPVGKFCCTDTWAVCQVEGFMNIPYRWGSREHFANPRSS